MICTAVGALAYYRFVQRQGEASTIFPVEDDGGRLAPHVVEGGVDYHKKAALGALNDFLKMVFIDGAHSIAVALKSPSRNDLQAFHAWKLLEEDCDGGVFLRCLNRAHQESQGGAVVLH